MNASPTLLDAFSFKNQAGDFTRTLSAIYSIPLVECLLDIENSALQNQTANFPNYLSALYSIPLIESLYDNGFSIRQMQNLAGIFTNLTSLNRYGAAFNLFLTLYDFVPIERPI